MKIYKILALVILIIFSCLALLFGPIFGGIEPGLFFGIVFSIWLYLAFEIKWYKFIYFTIGSTVAWFVAYGIGVNSGGSGMAGILIPSTVGALILMISTIGMAKLRIKYTVAIIIAGIIAGYAFIGVSEITGLGYNDIAGIESFLLWQLIIGLTLGYFVDKDLTRVEINNEK